MSGDTCGRRVGVEKSSRNGILASIRPQSRLILLSVSPRRIPVFPSIKRTRLEWWFPVASVSCSTRSSRAEIAAEIAYSDGIVPIPVFYVHSFSFSLSARRDEQSDEQEMGLWEGWAGKRGKMELFAEPQPWFMNEPVFTAKPRWTNEGAGCRGTGGNAALRG